MDTLFDMTTLQPDGNAYCHRRTVVQDVIDLDQQIDVSTRLMVINTRARQAYAGLTTEKLLIGGVAG